MIRKSLSRALLALAIGSSALPAVAETNLTDSWWSPTEAGWGIYLTHQGDTAGFGLLHYDAQGRPFFVTAGLTLVARTNPGNLPVLSGTLYRTTGPAFGGAFDPAQVAREVAGQVSFEPISATQARVHLSLNGQSVVKLVSRMTVDAPHIGGSYRHVQRIDFQAGTPNIAPRSYDSGTLWVDHQGSAVSMRFDGELSRCNYQGEYSQKGRYGEITGVYACNGGSGGAFTMTEVERTASGLSGKFSTLQGATGFVRGGFTALPMN